MASGLPPASKDFYLQGSFQVCVSVLTIYGSQYRPVILPLVIIIAYGSAFVLFHEHDVRTKTRLNETRTSPKESSLVRPRCPR